MKATSSNKIPLSVDMDWFYAERDKYLEREDFRLFQEISGVSFMDLISGKKETVERAQRKIADQSVIFNETRKSHFGFQFPFIVYTHLLELFETVPNHNVELEKLGLSLDMTDSLRRRHIALSYSILPDTIHKVEAYFGDSIIIKNLGSGVGLDVLNAVKNNRGKIKCVLNYDISMDAIEIGKRLTNYLVKRNEIQEGVVRYFNKNLTKSREKCHLLIKIGIICGLNDDMAKVTLHRGYKSLKKGGMIVVSSSNNFMQSTDPLASFVIQHIGTKEDPLRGWALNFRTKDRLRCLLSEVGFINIEIYDDANFPGRENLPDEFLFSVDKLPGEVLGYDSFGGPLSLPDKRVLDKRVGYNWIAVARK